TLRPDRHHRGGRRPCVRRGRGIGAAADETVFLDDLGINLKPARAMGMATIKVTDHLTALDELSALVGFPLR
ncbi:MAG: haloacid dehalogenase, partial [Actinomycetota bacterium]